MTEKCDNALRCDRPTSLEELEFVSRQNAAELELAGAHQPRLFLPPGFASVPLDLSDEDYALQISLLFAAHSQVH